VHVYCYVGPRCVDVHLYVGPRSVVLSTDDYHVHEVSAVLKRFLRTLDDAVLTAALYKHWISALRESVWHGNLSFHFN